MRKLIVLLAALFIVTMVGITYSSDQPSIGVGSPFVGSVPMQGSPGATKAVTVDNTVRTVYTLVTTAGGSWMGGANGTLLPIGVLLSCSTTDTRWAFGGTSPTTTVGHLLPAGGSWSWSNTNMIDSMRGISTTGDNTAVNCSITLSY